MRIQFIPTVLGSLVCMASATVTQATEITGKVFKVDPIRRTFELLKETEYDPKTDIGRSRFSVTWTENAGLWRTDEKPSFAGIKGPVWAKLQGIDAANRKAIADNKPFVVRVATIRENENPSTEPSIGENEVTGWFTPDASDTPRSGRIMISGKPVQVTMREKNSQILHRTPLTPQELGQGFWQVTLEARTENDALTATRIEATALPDPRLTDNPKLPRVLVIGDSISMNYHESAKAALKGTANYHRNDGNGGPSSRGVSSMELWLGNHQEKGLHWDVIQFNHGLHDLKQTYDAKSDTFGGYSVPLKDYQANLDKEISLLRKTGAKLIWCSTTPVPNDNKSAYARRKGASAEFNAAALDVIRRHPDILITDLHAVVDASPVFDNWRKQNDVHFYQKEEQQILGEAVASTIRKALEKR